MAANALKCRECKREYGLEARYVCELCFGPLEVSYDAPDASDIGELRRKIQGGPAEHLALLGVAAARERAPRIDPRLDRGTAGRLHAADQGRPPGRAARASVRSGSRTTPRTPRTPSRTAS